MMLKPTPTRPGDITSTTDPVPKAAGESNSHTPLILDLSEELVQLNKVHEEVAKGAMEHIQGMNYCWNLPGIPRDRTIGILNCQLPLV